MARPAATSVAHGWTGGGHQLLNPSLCQLPGPPGENGLQPRAPV